MGLKENYPTIESVDREIARLKKLLERPNYLYPNMTQKMIDVLVWHRNRLKHPIIALIKDFFTDMVGRRGE